MNKLIDSLCCHIISSFRRCVESWDVNERRKPHARCRNSICCKCGKKRRKLLSFATNVSRFLVPREHRSDQVESTGALRRARGAVANDSSDDDAWISHFWTPRKLASTLDDFASAYNAREQRSNGSVSFLVVRLDIATILPAPRDRSSADDRRSGSTRNDLRQSYAEEVPPFVSI